MYIFTYNKSILISDRKIQKGVRDFTRSNYEYFKSDFTD